MPVTAAVTVTPIVRLFQNARHGQLEPFNAETNWGKYRKQMEQYIIANDVMEEKRQAVEITFCGLATYMLLRNLLRSAKPSKTSLATSFEVLTNHFLPKPSEVVASFKLNPRTCHAAETAADFFASLNKLVGDCRFDVFRDRMLRDYIVKGINDEAMQQQILEIPDLT